LKNSLFGLAGLFAPCQGYLRDETVTFAEALAPAGYQRLYSGKWHCGGHYLPHESEKWAPGSSGYPYPLSRGFEKFFGTVSGAGSFFRPHTLMEQDQFVTDEEYFSDFYYTDAISDHACEMIRQADADRPLLLHTCYTAPHWPLHALEEDIAKYEAAYGVGWDELRGRRLEEMKSLGLLPEKWQLSPRDSAPPWDELDARRREWDAMRMAVYAAQIDRMDQGIGQIIAALKETGRWENTLVIFLADNGGCAEFLAEDGFIQHYDQVPPGCGPMQVGNRPELRPGPADTFMSYDTPWANASNTPFRLYKHWVHEGGISTPAICHWPGEIPAGTIRHQPCHIVDLMATFLDVGQAQYPTQKASRATPDLDGVTLAPLLRGQESWQRGRPIFFEHEGNRAIRDGQWKLVSRTVENRTELCDLAPRDPGRATRMARDYDAWATRADVLPWNQGPQPRG
jgi:arylsulfatase A-like enzyme